MTHEVPVDAEAPPECTLTLTTEETLTLKQSALNHRHVDFRRKASGLLQLARRAVESFYEELLVAARTNNRPDIAHAIGSALKRSRALSPVPVIANWLHTLPLLWRSGAFLLRSISQRSVVPRYVQHTTEK